MRLGTFNILNGRSPDDGEVHVDRFAGAVRELDCDVLALQEVDRAQERSGGADLTAVAAEAMGAPHHEFVAALSGTPGATWVSATGEEQPDSAAYGIALLSRHPVLSWQVVRLPALPRRVPVLLPGHRQPVLVGDEPRVAVAALVESPIGRLTVVGTHLSFVPGWNGHQLRRLLKGVRACERPLVLMGDFNTGPRRARSITRMRSLVAARTFPAHDPMRQIDHVLADGLPPHLHCTGGAVRTGLSDHRALVVDVRA